MQSMAGTCHLPDLWHLPCAHGHNLWPQLHHLRQPAAKPQGAIVESAAFWGDLLVRNKFPAVTLTSDAAARNIGLLGHSVGAGVATYVAKEAAAANPPRPFKAVMYMAAQTQVINGWCMYMLACKGCVCWCANQTFKVQFCRPPSGKSTQLVGWTATVHHVQ